MGGTISQVNTNIGVTTKITKKTEKGKVVISKTGTKTYFIAAGKNTGKKGGKKGKKGGKKGKKGKGGKKGFYTMTLMPESVMPTPSPTSFPTFTVTATETESESTPVSELSSSGSTFADTMLLVN